MSNTHALHAELHARTDAWRRERAHEHLAIAGPVPAREHAARQAANALASLVLDWLDAGGTFTASRPADAPSTAAPAMAGAAATPPLLTGPPTRQTRRTWSTWVIQHALSQRFAAEAGRATQRAVGAAAPPATTVLTHPPPPGHEPDPVDVPRDPVAPSRLMPDGAAPALQRPASAVQNAPTPAERPLVSTTPASTEPLSARATTPDMKLPHNARVAATSTPSKTPSPPPSAASLQDLAARFRPAGAKALGSKPSVTIQLAGARRPLSPD